MARSRERVIDLSHRMVERLAGTAGVSLEGEREYVRNQLVRFLLEWDKEMARVSEEATARLKTRSRRTAEGSREWDLLYAEEVERLLAARAGRGE